MAAGTERLQNALKKHLIHQDEISLMHHDSFKQGTPVKARLCYVLPDVDQLCVVITEGRSVAADFKRGEEVSINLDQEGICATSVVVQELKETAELILSYPFQCMAQERREKERIYSPNLLVRFQGKIALCKNCYDFGPGGFSVLFQKKEYVPCAVGEPIEVELFMEDKFIHLTANLVNIIQLDAFENHNYPYGGQRASFQWKNLTADDRILLKEMLRASAVKASSFAEIEESDPPRSLVLVK